ncbi:hypothetical protein FZW96_13980 [Bacillus sp. BGMRC 2118]|nr:hypothetical protein FZW96_13980 [Bacillus sp. BGMRC 2118]
MAIWKMYGVTFLEIFLFLLGGFFITENLMKYLYEDAGIRYIGNLWVVWFGLSFMLLGIYTLILSSYQPLHKDRIKSKTFWVIFTGSIIGVFIPFLLGRIPF